jgi:hypothetical protein
VTLVDGFVLARSAFHHSMNYRSVVVLGKARLVTDPDEKRNALRSFTNHIMPGRWEEVRQPTEQELKATSVLALQLDEVSAKVRTGPPIDDEEDYAFPVWAVWCRSARRWTSRYRTLACCLMFLSSTCGGSGRIEDKAEARG